MPTPDCRHPEFKSSMMINREIDKDSGDLREIKADLVVKCEDCGKVFYPQSMNEFNHIILFSAE